jgi:uncharacterized protein YndB with AHSA1/START domain
MAEMHDADPAASSEDLVLEIERVLPTPREAVFAAFGDPQQVAQWFGPEGFTVASLDFGPSVGKSYRLEMHPPEGENFHLGGEFRELTPPTRVAFTFAYEQPDPDDVETVVELSFEDLGESTAVHLTQGPFKTEARRALHREGWGDSLDKLERLLSAA